MDSLPPELLHEILSHVPKSSLPECRLVCRSFCMIAFPILFCFVPQWLNYEMSHRAIISLAHDVFNRPAVMWSPWAAGPDGPVEIEWVNIVWKMLINSDPPKSLIPSAAVSREDGDGEEQQDELAKKSVVLLTSANFAELSGREEMTENRLRTSQHRYLLHRAYASKVDEVF